ncbi:MAG: hypothetical protein V2B15_17365 [Bacteroidota bacterium]
MRTYHYLVSASLLGIMLLASCNQAEESGQLKFGLDLTEDASLKAATQENGVVAALVSVQDLNGGMVCDKAYLELIRFGDQYVTRSLEIQVGEFMLTEFMLVDAAGEVIWATPKEGSMLASLVRTPLPRFFGIHPNETTNLDIQVIRVNDYQPGDFGYAQFNIEFVNRFCLKVLFNYHCTQNWNDTTPLFDPAGAPVYQPRITIWTGNLPVLDEPLVEGLNQFYLPVLETYYSIVAFGCQGETLMEAKFGLDEMMKFRCGEEFPPLVIGSEPGGNVIITPEGLFQPNINQGIFGQITMPVYADGDTENHDIYPMPRDVYLFPYYVLDSIYSFAPVDCYFPMGMIWEEPIAIVRSNSDGFFQVPMDPGEYLYLVRTEGGFYMDAFISSHRPGFVEVFPGKVTELSIHVIDCSMWL